MAHVERGANDHPEGSSRSHHGPNIGGWSRASWVRDRYRIASRVVTECNGCGGCCDPVILPYTQQEAATKWRDQLHPDDLRWTLEDLTPMKPKEARAKEPGMFEALRRVVGPMSGDLLWFFYSCRHFDAESRRCRNYQNRPPVCRGFPWRDGLPQPEVPLPAACSFNADIGQPVELRRKS